MSLVTYHVMSVTRHRSLMPTATATDPPPANSFNMHRKDKKSWSISTCLFFFIFYFFKLFRVMVILAIRSSTRSLHSNVKRAFSDGTHNSRTLRLIDWIGPQGQCNENWIIAQQTVERNRPKCLQMYLYLKQYLYLHLNQYLQDVRIECCSSDMCNSGAGKDKGSLFNVEHFLPLY